MTENCQIVLGNHTIEQTYALKNETILQLRCLLLLITQLNAVKQASILICHLNIYLTKTELLNFTDLILMLEKYYLFFST